ncbi:malate dehydrogenase (quinone) [Blastococcus sp. TBT05-19]|uniref:malate dehydrogenase (quinone) n=1 Tax=Blastococcus sp. TBT05-19 TaxID=2250581 RepID=UPI000DEB39F6|nr:malate dehydrogenase (quinone) [Blastococcus sp. TBT05-19]RBY89124.1 malate dehydrogenase (quinone) [Blastococcus sp. TBT05-19]
MTEEFDAVLIGGGVMSATLGMLLSELEPGWRIAVVERLDEAGLESSSAWNNAGTGHAGLCEFNYTPRRPDGSVDVSRAVEIGEQFSASLLFWAHLAAAGVLGSPRDFVRSVPHSGFGRGPDGVAHLRGRYEGLRGHPLFADQEFSDDPAVLRDWLPLMFDGRNAGEEVAVTRSARGTDVGFGVLTRRLLAALRSRGGTVALGHEVRAMRRSGSGWTLDVRVRTTGEDSRLRAPNVFVGAGGGTLPLLQRAGVPEVRRYGAFPISGQFLRTARADLVAAHRAKVYGHADPGAPTISVPHLDHRTVDGREHLVFGPFAAFSPRFLRTGRRSDLLRSVRPGNVGVLAASARDNRSLMAYLVRQVAQTSRARTTALRTFVPTVDPGDWELVTAGQRVQVLKMTGARRGAMVGFGTELVSSAGGSLTALLGASPGASTAVATMVDVLAAGFPGRMAGWSARLAEIAGNRSDLADLTARTHMARRVLGLGPDGEGRS